MKYIRPLNVRNGCFYTPENKPLIFRGVDLALADEKRTGEKIREFRNAGIELIRLSIDETKYTDENGHATDLSELDFAMETAWKNGLYVLLVPVTKSNLKPFSPAGISYQQNWMSELHTHENRYSGKILTEYENLAAYEIVFGQECFTDDQYNLYLTRVMLQVYMEHHFAGLSPRVFCTDREMPSKERLIMMQASGMELLDAEMFQNKGFRIEYEHVIPGIADSVISGLIREPGESAWHKIAVGNMTSRLVEPHRNGGAEGFLTYASDSPVEIELTFPVPVRTAKYRPSLRDPISVTVCGNSVRLMLPSPRYGMLEINYGAEEEPAYTVAVLGDHPQKMPEGKVRFVDPGLHHAPDLKCGDAEILCFRPGLHDIAERLLTLENGKTMFLSRGAVVRSGVLAENLDGAKLMGQGILDGSRNLRDVGENKGDRMGEKWIEDAGREGFICFFQCRNMVFDGPVIYNPQFWNFVVSACEDSVIRNHKAISWIQNNDGIQPRSCQNLLVEHCFLKCNDDCIAVKTRRTLPMISRHYVFRDLVLWNDAAGNALELGHTSQGDLLEDLLFQNIEVIAACGGTIHGRIIDHSTVRNVRYENIWAEGRQGWCDIGFTIAPSYYTTDKEAGRLQNIRIRNVFFDHPRRYIIFEGFDEDHKIEDIEVENIVFECRKPFARPIGELIPDKAKFSTPIKVIK